MTLTFIVPGVPQTKGSARAFVIQKSGMKPRAIITNDNPKAKGWQQLIAEHASLALAATDQQPLTDGAILLDVWFYLPRPQRLLTRRTAPVEVPHTTRPDADKLLRVVKDALSQVVWHDDSQVIDAYVHKRYCRDGEMPRAVITVRMVHHEALPRSVMHDTTPTLFGDVLYAATEEADHG